MVKVVEVGIKAAFRALAFMPADLATEGVGSSVILGSATTFVVGKAQRDARATSVKKTFKTVFIKHLF